MVEKHYFITGLKKKICFGNKYTAGLVEFEDGTLDELSYIKIKFIDKKIKEFCFEEDEVDCPPIETGLHYGVWKVR